MSVMRMDYEKDFYLAAPKVVEKALKLVAGKAA
jgi:hypothetical protein